MSLLLDTHIWLWSLLEPDKLRPSVVEALSEPSAELWLSSISVFEFLTLARKRRVRIDGDPYLWLKRAFERAPIREAPVTHDIVVESQKLRLPHWDPADRFIAATAKVRSLTLVTSDRQLMATKRLKVLSNR